MATTKAIGAVIVTHNGRTRGYIAEAVESVLGQTHRPSEILVIDDASTDGTPDFVSDRFHDSVTVIPLAKNLGPSGARNQGIRMCNAPLIAFLDDDDKWLPNKLERQAALLQQQSADLVFGRAEIIDATGNRLGASGSICPETLSWPGVLFCNPVPGPSSVLARRDALLRVGCFPENLRIAEDWLLWAKLARNRPIRLLDETVTLYRSHPHQAAAGKTLFWIREQTLAMLREFSSDLRPAQTALVLDSYTHGGALRTLLTGKLHDAVRLINAGSGQVDWSIMLGIISVASAGAISAELRDWANRRHLQSLVRRFRELNQSS